MEKNSCRATLPRLATLSPPCCKTMSCEISKKRIPNVSVNFSMITVFGTLHTSQIFTNSEQIGDRLPVYLSLLLCHWCCPLPIHREFVRNWRKWRKPANPRKNLQRTQFHQTTLESRRWKLLRDRLQNCVVLISCFMRAILRIGDPLSRNFSCFHVSITTRATPTDTTVMLLCVMMNLWLFSFLFIELVFKF